MSRRPPLPRDPRDVVVEGFTHGGEGVARIEGKAVFVPGALPGETVRVRVVDDRRSWARAQLLDVVEQADGRTQPPCPLAVECGGCDLQHATPALQRELKTRVVREQLVRLGRIADPPVAACREVTPTLGYRSHARMHADEQGRLGFHRGAGTGVVHVPVCPVLDDDAQRLRADVGDHTGAAQVSLRADGGRAVVLHPGDGPLHVPDADMDVLLAQPDGTTAALRGDGALQVEVAGLALTLDATCFSQVSLPAAEALVEEVLQAAGDVAGAVTLDLYAGVGLLSLPLARAGAEVTAVEGRPAAAAHARANAGRNHLDVRVVDDDVRGFLAAAAADASVVDLPELVVLDPPRSGVGTQAMADLARLRPPRVVHVACDPAALARDVAVLVREGYRLRSVQPLDLFPMTHHVEAVALLTR